MVCEKSSSPDRGVYHRATIYAGPLALDLFPCERERRASLPVSDTGIHHPSGGADQIDHLLGLGACLDEGFGLRKDAFAECLAVAVDHRDALVLELRKRFLLDVEPMRAGVGGGLLRRIDEGLALGGRNAVERGFGEVDR